MVISSRRAAFVASFFVLSACGTSDNPSADNEKQAPTRPQLTSSGRQLVFAGIDPLDSPWHANLYSLDLASSQVSERLSGESGDPALFASQNELLFFNRTSTSQNFRRLVPYQQGTSFTLMPQQQFPGGDIGDPRDALDLGEGRVLLAHYSQGQLVVMKQSTGEKLQRVQVDWGLPEGVKLKPEALLLAKKEGRTFVYVVHQALALKEGMIFANGSQQVFVLELKGDAFALVAKVKLKGSFPTPVRYQKRDKFLLVSMCSSLFTAVRNDPARKCVSAIEELDPAQNSTSVRWDLEGVDMAMNGRVVPGPDSETFYASVVTEKKNKFVQISLAKKSFVPVYEYAPNSGGFWGASYDEPTKNLYIGDIGEGSVGKFVVLSADGSRKDIALDRVPYSLFIP